MYVLNIYYVISTYHYCIGRQDSDNECGVPGPGGSDGAAAQARRQSFDTRRQGM